MTRFFQQTIAVTQTEQVISLPALTQISIINRGAKDCQIEFDGDITVSSMTLDQSVPYNWNFSPTTLHIKAGAGLTTSVFITGVRQIKA